MYRTIKLFAFMALVTLFSCSEKSDKCILKGQFSEGNGDVIVYPYQEVHSKKEADSLSYTAKIVDGKFEIELDTVLVCRTVIIKIDNQRKIYSLFSEPGVITITEKGGKVLGEGSSLNDEYHRILELVNYEEYNNLRYKKELSASEQALKDAYATNLWKLAKVYPNSIALSNLFYQEYFGADEKILTKVINTFSKEVQKAYYIPKLIVRRDNLLKVAIGQQAPEFSLKNCNGEEISLANYKGKYVLLDFWASWCGPCRAEIPNLKNIYKDAQPKGLEMISISVDENEKAWLKAVEQEQMPWVQVRDTKSVRDKYVLPYIPMIFIIDPSGKIIDKKLHGEHLRKRVEEILK
ncbi:hypothetical protein DF185_03895 [Marinifilum breve]|uniref:Thioredoxin domain-containing protein n=1 Tax=Marinifilum breve TaxID=2184082 RepID=A0A2V4A2T9_9BACT|nr:TlpA disulfide reductase family protein [Marinifilum breve]PXY03235.1 hypothetical protein DF185_03895 [Marinifilum breve]